MASNNEPFYLRYYSGHSGRFGHEFLGWLESLPAHDRHFVLTLGTEFDFRVVGDGKSAIARYANNSNYRNDSLIRKESKLRNTCAFSVVYDVYAMDLYSVCECIAHQGNQANHQRERDHEVCDPYALEIVPLLNSSQGRRY